MASVKKRNKRKNETKKSKNLMGTTGPMGSKLTLKEFELAIALVLVLTVVISFFNFNSTITGFVSVESYTQQLDYQLTKSTAFLISSPSEVKINSFKLSGSVSGGLVEVYLDNSAGQRLLVYQNLESVRGGLSAITGQSIKEAGSESLVEKQILQIAVLKAVDEPLSVKSMFGKQVNEGAFENKCKETCFINMIVSPESEYQLIVLVEEGAVLNLDELAINVVEE